MKRTTRRVLIHRADPHEQGYWAEVPALPGCFTMGDTIEQTIEHAREAILCHIEGVRADLLRGQTRQPRHAAVPISRAKPPGRC